MRTYLWLAALALCVAFPGALHAGTYTAQAFNMTFSYPSGWRAEEMKMPSAAGMAGRTAAQSGSRRFGNIEVATPKGFVSGGSVANQAIDAAIGTAQDTAVAGVSGAIIESQIKKAMSKFAMVTFTNPAKKDMSIMFTAAESSGGAGAGSAAGAGTHAGVSKPKKGPDCKVLDQGTRRWGGRNAKVVVTRCASDDEYQYTASAMMNKGGVNYTLVGMMTAQSAGDADFNKYLKPAFDKMISTTRFN